MTNRYPQSGTLDENPCVQLVFNADAPTTTTSTTPTTTTPTTTTPTTTTPTTTTPTTTEGPLILPVVGV